MLTARSLGRALARAMSMSAPPRTCSTIGTASRAVLPVSQHAAAHNSSRSSSTQDRYHPHTAHTETSGPLERRCFFSQQSLVRQAGPKSDVHPANKSATHRRGYDEGPVDNNNNSSNNNHPKAAAEEEHKACGGSGGGGKTGQSAKSAQKETIDWPKSNGGRQDMPLHVAPDTMADADARGRTGGGEPLSSSKNAPPRPTILNASVPGGGDTKLTKQQQAEVDRHNKEFEDTFDHAENAPDDKVNKKFWTEDEGQ